jgi:hypothetical protein
MRLLLTAAGDQLRRAQCLPAVLDAACDAFEDILAIIGACEDTTTSTATAIVFLLAATQAANGRDAALFAPSLPPRSLRPRPPIGSPEQEATDDIKTAVADLGRLLAARLAATATTAAAAADRAACHDAARHARQASELLTGEDL